MTDTLVRIQTNHECLSNFTPVFGDLDLAIGWIRLAMGDLLPGAWVSLHEAKEKLDPQVLDAVREIAKVCFGVVSGGA